MTTKPFIMVFAIVCATLLFTPYAVYGHNGHNHGKGSGCGDCAPPTLGVDENGQRVISGGMIINSQATDVEFFKQTMSPQTINAGEPVEITLKVHSDLGVDTLQHVELNIGEEEKPISGVLVATHPVTIEWNRAFDGTETVIVHDKQNLIKDASVRVIDTKPIIGFRFTFTPTQEFDANTLVTKMWDDRRNTISNHFYNALEIESTKSSLISVRATNTVQVPTSNLIVEKSPSMIDQINFEIQCSSDQQRLLRVSDMSPVCVDAYQSKVLISNHWAISTQ